MLLDDRSSVVREELRRSAVANSRAPESPMELIDRSRAVREELCRSAVANSRAPESPILLNDKSRKVRVGSFERSRERRWRRLEEKKEEAAMFSDEFDFLNEEIDAGAIC